ncbi:MAG: transketolase [Candidatus Pelethousia sp.]|nr:transketolase [Candidatus Pelethousia sp.]
MDLSLEQQLKQLALRIRISTLTALGSLGFGHIGGSLSIVDTLAVLYGDVMRIRPEEPDWPERDKFVCSKGHAGPAVYATLALRGFFPASDLSTLNQPGTNLPSHCDRNKTRGIDMTTGSLGQGASLASGMALGDKLRGRDSRVFLMLGDGEINEGQVWEAAMFAAARKLDNLTVFVDQNGKQLDGYTVDILDLGDIAAKFEAFGFETQRVEGNEIAQVYEAVVKAAARGGKPHAIILHTKKGAGVPEVEQTVANHNMNFVPGQIDGWLEELQRKLDAMGGGEQ